MKKTGVVIVTYNNISMLESLLADILDQTIKPDQIIVIDNASVDNTNSVIAELFPMVYYVRLESNTGSAGGYYEGIKIASENNDLVWLLDDDVSVKEDALEMLLKWLDKIDCDNLGAVRSWGSETADFINPCETTGFAWRGTLIKKNVIKDIGLPRSDYFLYGEDNEYSLRMGKKGYSIFWIPESRVIEKRKNDRIIIGFLNNSLVYKDAFKLYYATRNQINLFLEYHIFSQLFLSFAYVFKILFLLLIFKRKKGIKHIKAIICGIYDGLRGHLGKNQKFLPV